MHEMLERWGLRVIGGTLKSPVRTSTGGEAALDDDLFLVDYVQGTPGFERAAPVLRHLYSSGLPLNSFRLCLPGEDRGRALIRQGWFDLVGLPDSEIPWRVLEEFEASLLARMGEAPYRPGSLVSGCAQKIAVYGAIILISHLFM